MPLPRRAILATLPALGLASCGGRPGETQVARDSRLVLAALTPLARDAAGFGLAPQAVAEVNAALSVAGAEAANLAAQVIPTRIDVQAFLVAIRAVTRALRPAPSLPPAAVRTLDAATALLPVMADLVSAPFAGPPPAMSAEAARAILRAAAPAAVVMPAPVAAPIVTLAPVAAPAPSSGDAAPAPPALPAESGLVTTRSRHSVADTLARLQAAIRANGWIVFTLIDHAAAARAAGLQLRPRTVVVFGDPAIGTAALRDAPTLGLDLPMRALVWQDEAGAVWLTTNDADWVGAHVYARHGLTPDPAALRGLAGLLDDITRAATQ